MPAPTETATRLDLQSMRVSTEAPLTPYAHKRSLENSFWYMGHLFTFLATGKDTGGRFTLIEGTVAGGVEPPPHIHHQEDEAFYVLEGEVTVQVGDQSIRATPGTFVFLPRGVLHTYKVETGQARMLAVLTPAGLEGYFLAFSEPARALTLAPPPERPYDVEKIIAVGAEYGVEWILPAPPAPAG
jgi:quercetin dioxygenase-like cupin family protein